MCIPRIILKIKNNQIFTRSSSMSSTQKCTVLIVPSLCTGSTGGNSLMAGTVIISLPYTAFYFIPQYIHVLAILI